MTDRRYQIPSASALVAFESAARHRNFSRAAAELNTSQSAISRHIAGLEARLDTALFERGTKRLGLTEQGHHLQRAVISALETLQAATSAIANSPAGDPLTIACSHEVSHLFIMPRFEALRDALGRDLQIRVMTYEYDALETTLDPRIDVMLAYQTAGVAPPDRAVILREAVRPVCAPGFAAAHQSLLAKGPAHWGALPFLALSKRNQGWATWQEWFQRQGIAVPAPPAQSFDNYVYLLEAAAAGRGLALGWRGLIERYVENRGLVTLDDRFTPFERALHGLLTRRGQNRPTARRCLEALRALAPSGHVDDRA